MEIDSQEKARREIIISLAGAAAERRATLAGDDGWRRALTRNQRTAVHEAGHLVIAAACGHTAYSGTIVADETIKMQKSGHVGGMASHGIGPTPPEPKPEKPERMETDFRTAAKYCWLFGDWKPGSWRQALALYRELKALTQALVEANWDLILALSVELVKHKTLNQEQLTNIIRPDLFGVSR